MAPLCIATVKFIDYWFQAARSRYVHTSDSMGSQTALGVEARAAGSA